MDAGVTFRDTIHMAWYVSDCAQNCILIQSQSIADLISRAHTMDCFLQSQRNQKSHYIVYLMGDPFLLFWPPLRDTSFPKGLDRPGLPKGLSVKRNWHFLVTSLTACQLAKKIDIKLSHPKGLCMHRNMPFFIRNLFVIEIGAGVTFLWVQSIWLSVYLKNCEIASISNHNLLFTRIYQNYVLKVGFPNPYWSKFSTIGNPIAGHTSWVIPYCALAILKGHKLSKGLGSARPSKGLVYEEELAFFGNELGSLSISPKG